MRIMMKRFCRCTRILILSLLVLCVFIPIGLLSHRLKSHLNADASEGFGEDLSIIDESEDVKEPSLIVYKDDVILGFSNENNSYSHPGDAVDTADVLERNGTNHEAKEEYHLSQEGKLSLSRGKDSFELSKPTRGEPDQSLQARSPRVHDEKVTQMKDQLIRAKAYLNFAPPNSSSHFIKELKFRIKELERAIGESTKDSDLSRSALQKMKAMEVSLLKASHLYPDCSAMVKILHDMNRNAEEEVLAQKNQTTFLVQLAARTTPKGLHCLSMRLTAEYFSLQSDERELPNQHKVHVPHLYHFAVFSDNVLACAVVVNSTISAVREPEKVVFHVVTDSLNLPSMLMWFLLNPPGKATIQVQSMEKFEWLSTNYDADLQKQEAVDSRYTSALKHLRFYLPDIFPLLNKIVLLDHDVVVQRDLTGLWSIDMKGKVNGAVETCQEGDPSFCKMDMYINFTDPLVAQVDANTCTWAFGMNIFDLQVWRKRNLTGVYQKYLHMGSKRPVFKAGTLPIGWITFYNHTIALEKRWHVLGLGYNSGVRLSDIEKGAVIHFDGIMKPWLDIGLERYKQYWKRHVTYDHPHLQQCNIHP